MASTDKTITRVDVHASNAELANLLSSQAKAAGLIPDTMNVTDVVVDVGPDLVGDGSDAVVIRFIEEA